MYTWGTWLGTCGRDKEAEAAGVKERRKPKYIENMLKEAKRRKDQDDRRFDRKLVRDRRHEGEEFADKEEFMTAGYRKKLEEDRLKEEEDKRVDAAVGGDVTKTDISACDGCRRRRRR